MCGIAGIVDFGRPAAAHAHDVGRMAQALHHRGPDATAQWQGRHACLGATRLVLLDRQGGGQPMHDPSGRYTLVYNGEIYDHAELRDALAPHWEFRTRSDTEVVLAALSTWGQDALPRLGGMFALAWWDEQQQRGLLARDTLGVKPLAYAIEADGLRFASEAKALVAVDPHRPRPNVPALLEVLAAPCLSGVTAPSFAGLHYLGPGQCLSFDRDGTVLRTWAPLSVTADRDDDAVVEQLRAALDSAVRRALRGDVPVGVFLSGGLDSTAIAAIACQHAPTPPHALTITFDGQAEYDYQHSRIVLSDDTPFAALAARELGLEQTVVTAPTASIRQALPEIARIDDTVPAWEQQLAQHHLAAAARHHGRAVLVGDAADETHYGYHFLLDDDATKHPRAMLSRFASAPCHPDWGSDIQGQIAQAHVARLADHGHDFTTPRNRILATTRLVLDRWLPRLLHNGDIHTMAFGVEARVPFADPALVALALSIDPRRALRGGTSKAVLREATAGLVPHAIATREKSAQPKDQRTARIYQALVTEALHEDPSLLLALCHEPELRALLHPERPLDEGQRAVLFRVAALAHWQRAYDVVAP
ncbi:MAG: asparagine synthase (glutamine-hydrolyzing) [Deltaproteobacteria bacterium]|nr:asparagine synthase (glutamine-hydrolyzing) [Deltaproteobacteria bacterium]